MGAPEPKRRALPREWVHRTPRGSFLGPLDGDSLPTGGARAPWRRSLEILRVLAKSDFRARYRAQALGVVWSLLNPLVMMAIISLVFAQPFGSATPNYPMFVLLGLVVWQWLANSVNAGTQSLVGNADLIKRTVFARATLPISSVVSYGINFLIESAIVLVFIPIYPHAFRLTPALLVIPLLLVALAALLVGVTLATSVLNVIYRDVAYIVNTALLIFYWLTPIIYPLEKLSPTYQRILAWNPVGAVMCAVRAAVMEGRAPSLADWAHVMIPTALVLAIGLLIFRRHERLALDYV